MKYAIFLLISVNAMLFSCKALAQNYSTENKKAIKLFNEAYAEAVAHNDDKALKLAYKAIEKAPEFVEPYIVIAEIQMTQKKYDAAIQSYQKLAKYDPEKYAYAFDVIGDLHMKNEHFKNAAIAYKQYLENNTDNERYHPTVEKKYMAAKNIHHFMSNPVPFVPVNLGSNVNSNLSEYHPTFTIDGKLMFYTVRIPSTYTRRCPTRKNLQEDFYIAKAANDSFATRKNAGPPLNTVCNEGAGSISADGRTFYFASLNRTQKQPSFDIYVAKLTNGKISNPKPLPAPVNTGIYETQPCISPDGKTLYFVRKIKYGNTDIFITEKQPDGTWSMPKALGININTNGREQSPFLHADLQTFYFASNNLPGLGGTDLYVSRLQPDGTWGKPKNLGYPINTRKSERSLIVSADGKMAYMASNALEGFGDFDLYKFALYKEIQALPVIYIEGMVYDKATKQPLQTQIELINLETGTTIISESEPGTGAFLVPLPTGTPYALNVSKAGYLFYSDHFTLTKTQSVVNKISMQIAMQPIQVGANIVLRNIFFETDKYALKKASKEELNRLIQFLEKNPTVHIEINGHTDNEGSETYNKNLSEKRAQSVYDFLIKNGIDKSRLSFQGYGESKPIASNETTAGRAKNRRTTFKVTAVE